MEDEVTEVNCFAVAMHFREVSHMASGLPTQPKLNSKFFVYYYCRRLVDIAVVQFLICCEEEGVALV